MKEFAALALKPIHPATRLSPALKVTFPATDATTVMFLAVRNCKFPPANEMDAVDNALAAVIETLFDELALK